MSFTQNYLHDKRAGASSPKPSGRLPASNLPQLRIARVVEDNQDGEPIGVSQGSGSPVSSAMAIPCSPATEYSR